MNLETLCKIRTAFLAGEPLPPVWVTGTDTFGIDGPYPDLEEGGEYVRVGLTLPGFYAEIDDGTYGTLNAIRIYRA